MDYDFNRREREFGRVVFALTLDKKRMTERIVIGRADAVRRLLNGGEEDVFYDAVRPLGSLLINFESDKHGEWNKNGMILRESYAKIFPRESARWKMAEPVASYLKEKYKSGEPSAMFAAVCTWEYYLYFYNQNNGAELLSDRLFMLFKPFMVYMDYKPWQKEAVTALSVAMQDGESGVELWYPVTKRPFETVVISSSFLPLISYYNFKINEWGYVFQECKVCNKYFIARSRHYELCSKKCRKAQAVTAKREHDERAKGDRLEQLHKSAYYYWYNRWRKLLKGKAANSENAAAFKIELDNFCNEAVSRKNSVKCREISLSDFSIWLVQQQEEADRLIEKFTK